MKNRYYLTMAVLLIATISITAQRHQSRNKYNNTDKCRTSAPWFDNMSDEQKETLKAERTNYLMDIQGDKNKLGELFAKKTTLETSEPIDNKALSKVTEEINKIKTSLDKKHVRHQQAIKAQLNDEQVLAFDNKINKRKVHKGNQGMKGQAQHPGKRQMKGKGQGQKGHAYHGGRGNNERAMLSDALKEQFKTAHIELMKEQQPLNNQLNELKAQLKTLTSGKAIDLKKVDKNIDQQAELKLKIAKLKNAHQQELRSELSDEQKLIFDKHKINKQHQRRM